MRDNRFTITIPRETWAAILDAIHTPSLTNMQPKPRGCPLGAIGTDRCGTGGRRYVDKLASQRRKGRRQWHIPRHFMG
jgi:hypothetical protein